MALFQFVIHGVLEVDADALGVAAANSIYGSDDPGGAGFEAGHAFRQDPAAGLELILGGSVLADLNKKFGEKGTPYWAHGFRTSVTPMDLTPKTE